MTIMRNKRRPDSAWQMAVVPIHATLLCNELGYLLERVIEAIHPAALASINLLFSVVAASCSMWGLVLSSSCTPMMSMDRGSTCSAAGPEPSRAHSSSNDCPNTGHYLVLYYNKTTTPIRDNKLDLFTKASQTTQT